MGATITAAANVYNEANAISGWLEMACAFFDDVLVMDSGPGRPSNDGTLEIVKKWGVRLIQGDISAGFGAVRTELIRQCRTDYCMILDADERFYPCVPLLAVSGQPDAAEVVASILGQYSQPYDAGTHKPGQVPSNWENLKQLGLGLRVTRTGITDQGAMLRSILDCQRPDVVATVRRHWHDFTWKRPTQDWFKIPDYQYRLVRCDAKIGFDPAKKMHEALGGFDPNKVYRAHPKAGPWVEHHHLWWKKLEPEQRAEDVRTYAAIHEGRPIE